MVLDSIDLALRVIKKWEGYLKKLPDGSCTSYPDVQKGWRVPTIGWGTTKYPDGSAVKKGDIITAHRAQECLEHEARQVAQVLSEVPTWPQMNLNQQAALIVFAYNLGKDFYGGVNFPSITKLIDTPSKWGDKQYVRDQFSKYCKSEGVKSQGLLNRRRDEATLFSTPMEDMA